MPRFKAEPVDMSTLDTSGLRERLEALPARRQPPPSATARRLGHDIDALEPWRLPDTMNSATRQLFNSRAQRTLPKNKAVNRLMAGLQEAYRNPKGTCRHLLVHICVNISYVTLQCSAALRIEKV